MPTLLYEQYVRRKRKFVRLLLCCNTGEEGIHAIRLEAKKIFALLRFMKEILPQKNIVFKKLKPAFHKAGEIREEQLFIQWLQQHDLLLLADFFIKKQNQQAAIQAFKKKLKPLIKIFEHQSSPGKKDFKEANQSIASQQYLMGWLFNKAMVLVKEKEDTEYWHKLRKTIKQILYAQAWLPVQQQLSNSLTNSLNNLQESIGKWHDVLLIYNRLLQYPIYLSANDLLRNEYKTALGKLRNIIAYRERKVKALFSNHLVKNLYKYFGHHTPGTSATIGFNSSQ